MNTAVELRAAFAARELSPVEIVDAAAERAELGAFVTLTLERAREEAKRAEQAYADGTARPLEGLTLAVKDLFDTEGVETTYGSRIYKGHVPQADAHAVKRARDAGAIVVGKTLTHEFAWASRPTIRTSPRAATRGTRSASRAGPPAAARSRSPPAPPRSRSAPTPAARSGSPRRSAASRA